MQEKRRVVIVGGSAAGLRCAARLRRLQPNWSITVVERQPVFSLAACGLPYVLSGDIQDPDALRKTADGMLRDVSYFAEVKGVEVLAGWTAERIDADRRELHLARGTASRVLSWDELVLATGARPKQLSGQPTHPRIVPFHTLDDLIPLHEKLSRGEIREVLIVGGGLVGCELAEAFGALWGAGVTLLEASPSILAQTVDPEVARVVENQLRRNDVALHLNCDVSRLSANEKRVTATVNGHEHTGDVAVAAIGVSPVVDLAHHTAIALGSHQGILVNSQLSTTVPHIWAIGDCVETRLLMTNRPALLPLGSLANRQGRTLANILAGRSAEFPPVAAAVVAKVFDLFVGSVGLTRSSACALGRKAQSVWLTVPDRAHYWPEAKEIMLHLVYEPPAGKVLGVQVVGEGDVSRPIDVATQWLHRKGTIEQLAQIEHGYAPPVASALDPLAVAAFAALNQADGVTALPPTQSFKDSYLLDVRHETEARARPTEHQDVTEIPLETLRQRINSLPDHQWVVVCEKGTRSAEAVRLLQTHGRTAAYLGGGLQWRELTRLKS